MQRLFTAIAVLVVGLSNTAAFAQGVLILHSHPGPLPRPHAHVLPSSGVVVRAAGYSIKELNFQARINDQVARIQVGQSFVNTGPVPLEVQFLFPLPYDGAVDQLTFMIDGKEVTGKLMPASEARAIYESIVRSNRDPALLEWMGMGLFQTSVFPVPAGAERKVSLRYNQLLPKDRGLTDFVVPLSTAKYSSHPVEKISFEIAIESTIDVTNVYSPTHNVEIKRPDSKHALVTCRMLNEVPATDFRLMYGVDPGQVGANVISYRPSTAEDGYFLLLASPQVKSADAERPRKTIVFVVDRSGSMTGKKFEQARSAMKFVLNNLREGDLFNIVAYDTNVESFRPELEKFNEETRKAAIGFVEGLYAGGGTNINGALTTALSQLKDDSRPNYVVFLTDGLPTVGMTNESQICQAAKASNKVRARILSFGVGYDVNSRLLDRISRDGFGLSEYVRPDEDIEAHVSSVYRNISAPVLTNATAQFEFDQLAVEAGPPINRYYPKTEFDLFEGQQLVIVGRYKKSGAAKVVIKGRVGDQAQSHDFPATLVDKSADETYAFVEKLWALRRIGEIIDQLDLVGKNDELVKELVMLSTRHGILTPYTSFLADETQRPLVSEAEGLRKADLHLRQLGEAAGRAGFEQRAAKGSLQAAYNTAIAGAKPASAGAGIGVANGPVSANASVLHDVTTGEMIAVDSVRQFGNQAVYLRSRSNQSAKILVTPETADLDVEKDKEKIEVVERYSEPYFALVKLNSPTENQILSQQRDGEQLLIKLRGKNFLVR